MVKKPSNLKITELRRKLDKRELKTTGKEAELTEGL